jgi:hypothetical protein
VTEKVRTFMPGEEVVIEVGFAYEGDRKIESVEAVFVREGSGDEIMFLGDAREETSGQSRGEARYIARLEARIGRDASPGEYRCARLSARNRLDDDWVFTDVSRLDLVVRVEHAPHQLKVTTSDFL